MSTLSAPSAQDRQAARGTQIDAATIMRIKSLQLRAKVLGGGIL